MHLSASEIEIPFERNGGTLLGNLKNNVLNSLSEHQIPVRFVITDNCDGNYKCELGLLSYDGDHFSEPESIFEFRQRTHENTENFNAVFLVPTGIGAEIGGHAGDATPVARLLASACDNLITHPNVVNASDINELPENGLYVEGSVITRLLMGTISLQKVRSNRILLVIEDHEDSNVSDLIINSASAARASLGLDCSCVVKRKNIIQMTTDYTVSGSAVGNVYGMESICNILTEQNNTYDAVAISSIINVPWGYHMAYFQSEGEMVNPWGGVEAMLTHAVSMLYDMPSAHAPMVESMDILNLNSGIVDSRMAAEAISNCYLHCVLKGLHKSPKIMLYSPELSGQSGLLNTEDISCLIIPDHCVGLPTIAALEQGIPVIAVRENRNHMKNDLERLPFSPGKLFIADNYLEAVGVLTALKSGVALSSVRRPLKKTVVVKNEKSFEMSGVFSEVVDDSKTT